MIEPTKAARRPRRRRSDGSRRGDGDGEGDARASARATRERRRGRRESDGEGDARATARRVDCRESVRSALDSALDSSRFVSRTTRKKKENEIKPNVNPRRDGTCSAGREASSDAFLSSAPGGAKTSDSRRRRFFSHGNKRSSRIPASRDGFRFEPTSTSTSTARERHVRVRDAAVRQSHAYAPRSTRSVQSSETDPGDAEEGD